MSKPMEHIINVATHEDLYMVNPIHNREYIKRELAKAIAEELTKRIGLSEHRNPISRTINFSCQGFFFSRKELNEFIQQAVNRDRVGANPLQF